MHYVVLAESTNSFKPRLLGNHWRNQDIILTINPKSRELAAESRLAVSYNF